MYGTETEVGIAIRESIAEGVVRSRDELFVTSKISRDFMDPATAIEGSLGKLGVEWLVFVSLFFVLFRGSGWSGGGC